MSMIPIYNAAGEHIGEQYDDAPELIQKTAEVFYAYSGNIVNTTGKTAPGTSLDGSIHFSLGNGTYFSNPFTTNTGKHIILYPKDKDGNAIYLTNQNNQRKDNIYLYASMVWEIVVNDLNFAAYGYQTVDQYYIKEYNKNYSEIGVLESKPAYWVFGGSGYTQGGDIDRGFTQGEFNASYIAYSSPTKTYVYRDELNRHIAAYLEQIQNDLFKPSENLLDYSKIIWHPVGGYYYLENGYYMPVTPGTVVASNNTALYYQFYESDYTFISQTGTSTPYQPKTVPQDAAWMRIVINTQFINENDELMIWVARNENSAPYERPIYRPHLKYNAKYADSDMFDYAVPSSLTQGVMRMARFAAIRAANERQSAYRFATFNVYVSTTGKGYPNIREMSLDYGLDVIGMQESGLSGAAIKDAMYPFQFLYGTGAVNNPATGNLISVPVISRFEITSTSVIQLKENRACAKVVMNMPQNKHYPRVPTLSVYNYHGSLNLANRLDEIDDMLDVIAEDTSDFIIIMGDTNSEVDQQGHRQSWDKWEENGFAAVHHGESPTWPNPDGSRYSSMDNIFVSSHINVLGYDIIRSTNYPLEDGRPLSDHDLVFADLQFDFDAVLKDTWVET